MRWPFLVGCFLAGVLGAYSFWLCSCVSGDAVLYKTAPAQVSPVPSSNAAPPATIQPIPTQDAPWSEWIVWLTATGLSLWNLIDRRLYHRANGANGAKT